MVWTGGIITAGRLFGLGSVSVYFRLRILRVASNLRANLSVGVREGPRALLTCTIEIGKKRGLRLKGEQLPSTKAPSFDHPHGALQAHLVVAQAGKTEEQLALKGSVPRRPISAQLNVHCCTHPECQQKCPSSNSPSSPLRPALQTCQIHAAAAHLAGGGGKRYVWEVRRR